jgi:hypothetical protein
MLVVPREVVFRAGSQRTASCRLEELTLPCPVDADAWLRLEYGDDYLNPRDFHTKNFFARDRTAFVCAAGAIAIATAFALAACVRACRR